MKLNKHTVNIYKWTPFWLLVAYISNIYCYNSTRTLEVVHLLFFGVFIVPFIYTHGVICRHIYTKCQKGEHYEF